MNRCRLTFICLALAATVTVTAADDLTGSDLFLCTAAQVTACAADGECINALPWTLNIPQFIKVDTATKTLSTTEASGENRSTPIEHLERADGLVIFQGTEQGRAFSFVIGETTGMLTVAVAKNDEGVVVFGACTPIDRSE